MCLDNLEGNDKSLEGHGGPSGRSRSEGGGVMQDPASELPRNPIPRTWVNKGIRKGRGVVAAPALVRATFRYTLEGTL